MMENTVRPKMLILPTTDIIKPLFEDMRSLPAAITLTPMDILTTTLNSMNPLDPSCIETPARFIQEQLIDMYLLRGVEPDQAFVNKLVSRVTWTAAQLYLRFQHYGLWYDGRYKRLTFLKFAEWDIIFTES